MGPANLEPGTPLGAYRIVGPLGRGGMGVVYKAQEVATGRLVAIKMLAPEVFEDERFRARFEREGRAAAQVSHANVTTLYFMGAIGKTRYLVFELVPGGSLADRIKQGKIPWREATSIAAKIARGLDAIHSAGLVHRDLKPANVLLDARGEPKIADLGLARTDRSGGGSTASGEIVGTVEYLAPEQGDSSHVDERADLYALGATLYCMLAGRPPFQGTTYQVLAAHATGKQAPSLRALDPEIPRVLEELMFRLMGKEPAARGAGAAEVAKELEAIASGEPGKAVRRGSVALAAGAFSVLGIVVGALALAVGLRGRAPDSTPPPSATASPSPVAGAKLVVDIESPTTDARFLVSDRVPVKFRVVGPARRVFVGGESLPLTRDGRYATELAVGSLDTIEVKAEGDDGLADVAKRTIHREPRGLSWNAERKVYVWDTGHGFGIDMVWVPPGKFTMGYNWGETTHVECRPVHQHPVTGFWIGRDEVTVGQLGRWTPLKTLFAKLSASDAEGLAFLNGLGADHPVVGVTWDEARNFAEWIGLRLPREPEWEKAARGTDGRHYPWGNAWDGSQANFADESARQVMIQARYFDRIEADKGVNDGYEFTAPAGSFPKGVSPYGARDMAGNAAEWCDDFYEATAYERYARGMFAPPTTGLLEEEGRLVEYPDVRVVRGGSWYRDRGDGYTFTRLPLSRGVRQSDVGFRVALSSEAR